jgi:hypothetical protein
MPEPKLVACKIILMFVVCDKTLNKYTFVTDWSSLYEALRGGSYSHHGQPRPTVGKMNMYFKRKSFVFLPSEIPKLLSKIKGSSIDVIFFKVHNLC